MKCLTDFAEKIDSFLRFTDLSLQSLDGTRWLHERFGIKRHNIDAFLWPAVVAGAVIAGMPKPGPRLLLGFAVSLAAFFFFVRVTRWTASKPVRWDLWAQAIFLLALCAATLTGSRTVPEGPGLYLHLLVPITALSALAISAAAWLAPHCFSVLVKPSQYNSFLSKAELFQNRNRRLEAGLGSVIQAALLVITRPLRFVWIPAIVAIAVPPRDVVWAGLVAVVASGIIWTLAGLDERLDEIATQLTSRLFRNTALVISLLIIGLGLARIAGVTYVTTVLDSASGWEILLYLIFGYAIAFWSDYWMDRITGEQMLKVAGQSDCQLVQLDYPVALDKEQLTSVPSDRRVIRLHGIGRFLVLRDHSVDLSRRGIAWTPAWVKSPAPAFQTWTYSDFFAHLQVCGDPRGVASPLANQIQVRLWQFYSLNALVFAIALAFGIYQLSTLTQVESARASSSQPSTLTLTTLLQPIVATGKPPIFIAASGGGTRAALFTAAVLEGISRAQGGKQVVLGSGVSGGGASLAYFASNRGPLIDNNDWDSFFSAISKPFIQDVLDRSSEWRMVSGDRLGTLLQESFGRYWKLPPDRDKLGKIDDFGLIFNTTLAGHYKDDGAGPGTLAERASRHARRHHSNLAGGRLILTNLGIRSAFEGSNLPYYQQVPLPVVVDDPAMPLVTAAALNANFPPVFSNAPVDVDQRTRYWVTDGGAADNRGLEMLLYVLRDTLAKNPSALPAGALILVVDAGAESDSFSQDRGIGSAIGAGAQFAMHLSAEIKRDIDRGQPNVKLIYLRMPRLLRASGSFGTHWMLQDNIRVDDPHAAVCDACLFASLQQWWAAKSVTGGETITMLRALYGGQPSGQLGAKSREVLEWLRESEEYTRDWKAVTDWLATGK